MNTSEALKALSARLASRPQNLDELTAIFEDYKILVGEIAASDSTYRTALQHLPEEYPDLQRLIGRKFDAVLKGRLIDAVSTLKKKVEALESPQIEEADQTNQISQTDQADQNEKAPEGEKRVRNMPTLGMD